MSIRPFCLPSGGVSEAPSRLSCGRILYILNPDSHCTQCQELLSRIVKKRLDFISFGRDQTQYYSIYYGVMYARTGPRYVILLVFDTQHVVVVVVVAGGHARGSRKLCCHWPIIRFFYSPVATTLLTQRHHQ